MGSRRNYSSGTKWENEFSYSRGVRYGDRIIISGTTSIRDGHVIGENDIATQARVCLEIIKESVGKLGGSLGDVVRTRMFLTDIGKSAEVGRIHSEFFRGICPAATMVEVNRLIDDRLMIEIEAEAMV